MPVAQAVTDEITPIALYVAHEMNTNAHGPDARRMYELNTFSSTKCIAEYQRLAWWRQLMGAGIAPEQCVKHQITLAFGTSRSRGQPLMTQRNRWLSYAHPRRHAHRRPIRKPMR
jgi:hypothetical protein